MLAVCDGMVWAELASAVPSSGGTFEYLKVAYAGTRLGRLLPFLFIWQFILSGPLEIASGNIGFAQYLTYLVPMDPICDAVPGGRAWALLASCSCCIARSSRWENSWWRCGWACILTMAAVLVPGLWHFDARAAFAFPPGAFTLLQGFLLGLGSAMLLAMYDFFGYYSVCYIGDEVRKPVADHSPLDPDLRARRGRDLPGDAVSIISVVPWQEADEVEVHRLRCSWRGCTAARPASW